MAFSITGLTGELRAGGRTAAVLGKWDVEQDDNGWVGHAATTEKTMVFGMADQYEIRLKVDPTTTLRWRSVTIAGENGIKFWAEHNPERMKG